VNKQKGNQPDEKILGKDPGNAFSAGLRCLSMVIGIAIGKWYGISNFELTPPIDAIKSIFHGSYQFTLANSLALGVVIGLFLMIYPAMTNVKIEDMGKAARSPRQLLIVLFFNFSLPFFILSQGILAGVRALRGPVMDLPLCHGHRPPFSWQ
jgi:ACR3 family arsenite efflux pump ArsB